MPICKIKHDRCSECFCWFLYIVAWGTKNNIIALCLRFNTQENINGNIILYCPRSILEVEK